MLKKLGKYEILDEIGHGGMATVYRARDSRLDRMVAIKIMHPHLRAAPEARVRFAREARSVAKLRHGNILEIYDSSEEDSDEAFIVTELLTGPTLKEFAEAHPNMPAEVAACFTIEIAHALASAHGAGIVHRDVKPENVLLHEDRCIKLTDFGIAQMVDSQSFTATGQILGSPGHMAPEQVEGGDCDHRTDLFSLGTVLYYLACGRLPFSGRNPHQVLKRIVDSDYADPLRVRPSIGGKLRQIIVRSLAKDPAERYQTAESFAADLEAYVAEAGIEDCSVVLAEFLPNPEEYAARHRAHMVELLIARGKKASESGDVPQALDDFNRVLALDEGNPQVLELIERLGLRSRLRIGLLAAGALLGVFGIGAIGYALFGNEREEVPVPVAVAEEPPDAAIAGEPDAGTTALAERDAGEVAEATDAGDSGDEAAVRSTGPARQRHTTVRSTGPRVVRFSVSPQSVEIGVDGAEPRPYGPSFSSVELDPGAHDFVFGGDCCVTTEETIVIPPGDEPFVLRRRVPFAGRVMFKVEPPDATAEIETFQGWMPVRPNFVMEVPQSRSRAPHRIRVTAEGYQPYTGTVALDAEPKRVELELEAEPATPGDEEEGPGSEP